MDSDLQFRPARRVVLNEHAPAPIEWQDGPPDPPDNEVEKYMEYLAQQIAGTNDYYNREVAPRKQQAHEAAVAERAETKRRVEEAQARLDGEGRDTGA